MQVTMPQCGGTGGLVGIAISVVMFILGIVSIVKSTHTHTPRLTSSITEESAAVIVIDESVRRKLGKLRILDLIQNLTSPEMNCYIDIIPTGTSDIDVIKVFKSYVNIPALILTSDKKLYVELFGHSVFVKANRGTIRIVTEAIEHRISRS
jgi:hypothetical protein